MLGLRTQADFDLGMNVDVKLSSLSYLTFGLTGGMESKCMISLVLYGLMRHTIFKRLYTEFVSCKYRINLFAQDLHLGASMFYTHFNGNNYKMNERFSFYFNGSYLIPVAKSWAIKPSCLVRMFYGQTDIDYGLFVLYKDWVWLGVANRLDHALIFMADFKVTNLFRLGYSYDYSISKDVDFKYNSHEIRLEFNIPHKKKTFERLIPD
jgi:hypothetical protein